MKTLLEFLKTTGIDKDYLDGFANAFCIVDPINDIFVDFLQKYEDSCVQLKDGFKVFILKKKEAAQYANEDDVAMFKVPEQCKNMETLIKYLVNIDNTDSLEEYTQKEMFAW